MRPFPRLACPMTMSSKLVFPLLALCAAAVSAVLPPASAAGPPLPLIVAPNTAQERAEAQLNMQQAQAQARLAASQARVQAQLNANQARLEGQVAAQQIGTQAQLDASRQSAAAAAQLAALSLPIAGPIAGPTRESPAGPMGAMELTTLTPQLGSYFGADQGVLVVHAPTHGILKLQDGDVILSIGGRIPASRSQAIRILTSYDPGDEIRLVVLRQHRRLDITATMPAPPPGL